MDEARARAAIEGHFAAAGRDETVATDIYTDDGIIEFPQGGERISLQDRVAGVRLGRSGMGGDRRG